MVTVIALALASLLMLTRPLGMPTWAGPAAVVVGLMVLHETSWRSALDEVRLLQNPLLFLIVAVPLAVTLDDIGVFTAIAAMFDGGRHLTAWLWWLAAGVVVVFNLDAAVVLLTPLYIRIARRHGIYAEALAFQPALLACLASGVLPVSNLTNLIVAERFDLDVADFLRHLALPSLAATVVGYFLYRRVLHPRRLVEGIDDPVDPRALRRGVPIIVAVLVGFTLGDLVGVPAWMVAGAALAWASLLTRRLRVGHIPFGAVVTAASLMVLVGAALPNLRLERLFGGTGALGSIRTIGVTALLSNLSNNLPAVLAASTTVHGTSDAWPILVGGNIGAVFLATGSLSTVLWRSTAARNFVEVSPWRWMSVAVRVGGPALVVATLVSLLTT